MRACIFNYLTWNSSSVVLYVIEMCTYTLIVSPNGVNIGF